MKNTYREKLKKTWTDHITVERERHLTRYSSGTVLGESAKHYSMHSVHARVQTDLQVGGKQM